MLNCSSIAKVQVLLNHMVAKRGVHIEIPLAFVTPLVNIDWIVRGTTNPGKISFFYLGQSLLHQKSSATEKATLALQLQELYSSNLSSDNIQALIQSNYAKVKGYTDLSRLVNAAYVFLVILLGDMAAFTLKFEIVKSHVQTDYYYYEIQFQLDPLFGVKFIQKLDRTFQLFLSKCMDRPTLQQVGPSACNLSGCRK